MEPSDFINLVTDMVSPFFWLQKSYIAQKDGKIDMCVSYYLNALRHTPTSVILMFNLAKFTRSSASFKTLKPGLF